MRVHFLLVKDLFKGGGIETYTRVVGSRLAQRGHEVTVYSTGGEANAPTEWNGMKVVWLPKAKPYWAEKVSGAVMAAYRELTTENPPDVVHLHSVAAGAMAAALRFRSAPCVVQMHGIEWKRSSWGLVARATLAAMEQCSVAFGHAITAVSKTQCDYYDQRYGTKCEYIPTAVDIKEPAEAALIRKIGLEPKKYALFAARLVPEKGAHYLIPAFRRMDTDQTLAIAGGGGVSDSYRQELTALAGGDERIKFLGDVRGRLLEELFSNATAFVQPSELEGLSIGLIEAMSYGLRCVASDIPENREVIGEAGYLFRNRDENDLRRALKAVVCEGAGGSEVGAAARRRVAELFCWDVVVDQLEALYARTIAERKRRLAARGVPALQEVERQSSTAGGK